MCVDVTSKAYLAGRWTRITSVSRRPLARARENTSTRVVQMLRKDRVHECPSSFSVLLVGFRDSLRRIVDVICARLPVRHSPVTGFSTEELWTHPSLCEIDTYSGR